ncbi:MAG: ATP-binding protein [Acidobacteriota bacterium]
MSSSPPRLGSRLTGYPRLGMASPEQTSRLLSLIAVRMLVVASVTVPYLLYNPDQVTDPKLQFFIAMASVQSLLYIVLLRVLRTRPEAQAYIQLCGDLIFITLLIDKLEAMSFSILYIFIISVAAVFLNRTGVLIVAGLAYLLYLSVVFGWIRLLFDLRTPLPSLPEEPGPMFELSYNLIVHVIGFYGVAILTSYLARDAARSEEQLRKNQLDLTYLQGLYGDVIQSMSSGLLITDIDTRILNLNRSGEEILGRSEAELIGDSIEKSGILTAEQFAHYVGLGERNIVRSEGECLRGDGTEIHVGYTLTQLRDTEGNLQGYILLFQDLSEWHELQQQLQVQDRMAAMGQMAAGLAHEVGNPLAAISGSVQMLAAGLQGDASRTKLADIILKESHRLDRTVKAFLQFAKPSERNPAVFDIAAMLVEDTQLLSHSGDVQTGHAIAADVLPDSAMIRADFDQISQIFWNLARNALQAMPNGGQLTISGRIENEYYHMEFLDTGIGMTEEERGRLFHPFKSFFGGGTGLGMAIVYRIVKEHGGNIRVESEPNKGSRITVELPIGAPEEIPPEIEA